MQAEKTFEKLYSDDWDEPPPPRRVVFKPAPSAARQAQPPAAAADQSAPQAEASSPDTAAEGALAQANAVPIPMAGELDRVPGLFARSAIFRAARGGQDIAGEKLPCYGDDYSVVYTGPRLGMRDKRVWEIALRAAKEIGCAGEEFALSATAVALALRPPNANPSPDKPPKASAREIERVAESFRRLARAQIDYRVPGSAGGSAKLLGSARKTASGWRVSIDAGLIPALRDDNQFKMQAARRDQLARDLAKWLHDFILTHSAGFQAGFMIGKLAELCGRADDVGHMPADLKVALQELSEACPQLVAGFEIKRKGREAKAWRVRIDKGDEKESFRCPAKEALSAAKKAAMSSRKRGPAL